MSSISPIDQAIACIRDAIEKQPKSSFIILSLPWIKLSEYSRDIETQLKEACGINKLRIIDISEEGLVVKLMPGRMHAVIAAGFTRMLDWSLGLSMRSIHSQLGPTGCPLNPVLDRCKEPDGGFRPDAGHSLCGTMLIEVGDQGSIDVLRKHVLDWFLNDAVYCITLLYLSPHHNSFLFRRDIYRRSLDATGSQEILKDYDAFSWTPDSPLPDIKLYIDDFFGDIQYLAPVDQHLWGERILIDSHELQQYLERIARAWRLELDS